MLNVHQLNVFITAAETLNFTETAKRLHLTQSSVSQSIKSLESQLEVELFVRNNRSITVSDAGNVLLPMAREVVAGSIRATERMAFMKKEIHGHILVGCNTATGKYVLPILCAQFHKEYPLVRITCKVLPQDLTLEKLTQGEIHFAFTNASEPQEGSAEFKLYFQEALVLIAPSGHPWAGKEISPRDLYQEQYIMREPSSGTYVNSKRALTKLGIDMEKLDVVLELGASEAIALAVQQGIGLGFVSEMIVKKICPDSVSTINVKGLELAKNVYFGRQNAQVITAAQAAFWDFINSLDTSMFLHKSNVRYGHF